MPTSDLAPVTKKLPVTIGGSIKYEMIFLMTIWNFD
jgi:hypothetical protein